MSRRIDLGNCQSFSSTFPYPRGLRAAQNNYIYGHSVALIGHRLYVFGGRFDYPASVMLYVCDTNSYTWRSLVVNPGGRTLKGYMVSLAFVHRDKIFAYVFKGNKSEMYEIDSVLLNSWCLSSGAFPMLHTTTAGAYHEQTEEAFLCNGPELYVLDMITRRYTKPKTKGSKPRFRVDHSCCTSPTTFFLGGGSVQGGGFELYALKIKQLTWAVIQCATPYRPPRRNLFSMSYINERIFVMGGYNCWNQLDVFSVSESKWYCVVSAVGVASGDQMTLEGSGLMGGTRHHAAVHTKDKIYFVGGHGDRYVRVRFLVLEPGTQENSVGPF